MKISVHVWFVAEFSVVWIIFQTKFVNKIKTLILCPVTFLLKIMLSMR